MAENRRLMKALVIATPMGFIATEAGWITTELGRQPWVIYGILKTKDAVTPMPGLVAPFVLFTLIYLVLAGVVVALIRRTVLETAPRRGAA